MYVSRCLCVSFKSMLNSSVCWAWSETFYRKCGGGISCLYGDNSAIRITSFEMLHPRNMGDASYSCEKASSGKRLGDFSEIAQSNNIGTNSQTSLTRELFIYNSHMKTYMNILFATHGLFSTWGLGLTSICICVTIIKNMYILHTYISTYKV